MTCSLTQTQVGLGARHASFWPEPSCHLPFPGQESDQNKEEKQETGLRERAGYAGGGGGLGWGW